MGMAMGTHFTEQQLAGRSCIWCDREGRQMVPCGHLGERTLSRCWPDCDESLPSPRPDRVASDNSVDVMGAYLERGWSVDGAGGWHSPA